MPSIPEKSFVSPWLARAATSTLTEQDARIERLKRLTADARRRGREKVTIKLRDLETIIAVMAIPSDLERLRA